jgi:hypothetical protein
MEHGQCERCLGMARPQSGIDTLYMYMNLELRIV